MSFDGQRHTAETRARMSAAQSRRPRKAGTEPGFAAMVAAAAPGECPFCGDPIPEHPGRGRKPKYCLDEVCAVARFKYWRRDQRRAERQEARP